MKISKELKMLCEYIDEPIYIVGGYVRDSLLSHNPTDIDICSKITITSLAKKLLNTDFKVENINNDLGTGLIKNAVTHEKYEYATFRKEEYGLGHTPIKIELGCSLLDDAKRRDFTINAIYYNIADGEYIDPLGGLEHLKSGVVTTCLSPDKTLSVDGERILRLARISCELGFDIGKNTLSKAVEYAHLIADLSYSRIAKELDLILVADKKYNTLNAQYKGLKTLEEIGALEYIMPELHECVGALQNPKYHAYSVIEHIFLVVLNINPKNRLAGLFHDIAKGRLIKSCNSSKGHNVLGGEMAEEIMTRFGYSKSLILDIKRLVNLHMVDYRCELSREELRLFIMDNFDIIEDLIELKTADALSKGRGRPDFTSVNRLKNEYKTMLCDGCPMSHKDLKITPCEITEKFGKSGKELGQALQKLFLACVANPSINESVTTNEKFLESI